MATTPPRSYDELDPAEQAIVRAQWSAQMNALRDELDLAGPFAASGRTWVELDDEGNVVELPHAPAP